MRRITIVTTLLGAALAALAIAGPASAVTTTQLEKAGWTCIPALPLTPELHCFGPDRLQGLFSGQARAVKAMVFEDGEYLGTELNLRGDTYHGQPCPTDPPTFAYTHLLPIFGIDYWACHRFDSDHT